MKRIFIFYFNIYILFFFISFEMLAQPGEQNWYASVQFANLSKEINEDPNNDSLICERIGLCKASELIGVTDLDFYNDRFIWSKEWFFPYRDPNQLLDDVDKVIKSNYSNMDYITEYNIAYFTMLKGRFNLLSGKNDEALKHYLSALKQSDAILTNKFIKQEIYVSLAAYYYNMSKSITAENTREALKFINLACPNDIDVFQSNDCFEKEKKKLLKLSSETHLLCIYYQELIKAEYNAFNKFKIKPLYGSGEFDQNRYYRILIRIYELVEFHKENGDCKKARSIKMRLLNFLPPKKNGKPYKIFPAKNFSYWITHFRTISPK